MKVQIPFPCSIPLDSMPEVQGGKFCNSCDKIVIDFTKMTTEEILDYFNNKADEHLCGIFTMDLLEDIEYSIPLEVVHSNSQNIKNVILICFMVAFGFMSFELPAQGGPMGRNLNSEQSTKSIDSTQKIKNQKNEKRKVPTDCKTPVPGGIILPKKIKIDTL